VKTGEGCSVCLVVWSDYKMALLSGMGSTWQQLLEADLIIGGVEFDADFM
jgi:hypothetical protein